ncbi:MAG TPA: T9SS type A sorting domain-containing protein [Flavobacteriales bacterium]|nr:T9SS type A sorting domain-containing protein [Flavobacteriales bacterium]
MKKLYTISTLLIAFHANAQMVGTDAYMQGNFVEIGINGLGGYEGVDTFVSPAPAGMHFRSNTSYFGFVANPQMDLWTNYDGDYYTPGTPENGWGIEIYDTTATDTFNLELANNCSVPGAPDIPGYITGYSYTGGVIQVNWHGDYLMSGYDLDFDIEYTLGDSDLYYTTNVTIFNNGPANIEELYYYRNIDPDNNLMLNSTYVTVDSTLAQASPSSGIASVKAEQLTPWLSTFAFFANDTSARVSRGGFSNRDASDIWNGTGGMIGTVGTTTNDEAVSIAFKQPNLLSFTRASGTYQCQFSFQTAFAASAVNYLIGENEITGVAEVMDKEISMYPNPASDLLNIHAGKRINRAVLYTNVGTIAASYSNVNSNSMQLDLSQVEKGIYFLVLENESGKITRAVVKQ